MSGKIKHMKRSHKTYSKDVIFKSEDKAKHEMIGLTPIYKNRKER